MSVSIRHPIRAYVTAAILASCTRASIQDPLNHRLIPPFTARSGDGEIEYAYDTLTKKGTARYRALLGSGGFVKRLLGISPTVHTVVASYEFAGWMDRRPPTSVRLTLVSDEYYAARDPDPPMNLPMPVLVLHTGDGELRYAVGVAQKIELSSAVAPKPYKPTGQDGRNQVDIDAGLVQMHVERFATARLEVCDFVRAVSTPRLHGAVAGLDFEFSETALAGIRQFVAEMQLPATACASEGDAEKTSATHASY